MTTLLEMVQLAHLADRYPHSFPAARNSVWRWRARWLWNRKFCCLMNRLARWMRRCVKLRRWLRQLHEELKFTSVFVTHDQEEAMEVADRVVVASEGQYRTGRCPGPRMA